MNQIFGYTQVGGRYLAYLCVEEFKATKGACVSARSDGALYGSVITIPKDQVDRLIAALQSSQKQAAYRAAMAALAWLLFG